MSQKIKSTIYFAGLVIALIAYSQVDTNDTIQNTEMANNTIEKVATQEALN